MNQSRTKILIAVDDTEESIDALRTAYGLFGPAPDYLITSIGELRTTSYPTTPSGGPPTYVNYGKMTDMVRENATATAMNAASEVAVDAAIEVGTGPVGQAICRIAEESGASVIVIGSHDRSIWARLFHPSIGKYVVDNAPCPVLVVR